MWINSFRWTPDQASQLRAYRDRLVKLQSTGFQRSTYAAPSTTQGQTTQQALGNVPIKRRQGGTLTVDVKFNNRRWFEMLVDSGASVTTITRSMAKELGITPADIVDRVTFSTANGTTELPIVYLNVIEVGGLKHSRLPVAVAGPEMDIGLLGQDFMQQYDVSFRQHTIEFRSRQ